MEATTLSSHSLHFNLLRAKPFRNQGGLLVHNLQFNRPLYAGTYLSLRSNGSRSLRRHSLLLRTPLTSERDKRFSVYCSDQLQSNHLNVGAKPVKSSHSEFILPTPDAETTELNSMDISEVKDLQTRPEMFRNRFLDFVGMGPVFNDAVESFFKSEIRRRLFVTAVLIAISRIGYFIPLPGFDRRLVPKDYLSFVSGTVVDELGNSALSLKLSLFQLGISPQIGASVLMQVLCLFVPSLALLRKEGLRGYEKIKSYIWWISLTMAIFEGFIIALYSLPYSIYAASHRIMHVMVTTALMVLGNLYMSGICNQISKSGFGEGSSLIICTGILTGYIETLFKMVSQLSGSAVSWWPYILSVLGVFTVVTMWAVVVTEGCRKIKLQYYGFELASAASLSIFNPIWRMPIFVVFDKRRQRIWYTPLFTASIIFLKLSEAKELFFGGRDGSPINEVEPYIPLNINPNGMLPVLTTSYLFAVPGILASLFRSPFWENVKEILNPKTSLGAEPWVFYSIHAFCVFVFNILDIANVPKEISDYLNIMDARIPNVKPGKATIEHLIKIQASTRFWGGLLLTFLATTSTLLDNYLRRMNEGFSIGFTSVLIIVGSIIQLRRSYQAYNVMPTLTNALKRYGVQGSS